LEEFLEDGSNVVDAVVLDIHQPALLKEVDEFPDVALSVVEPDPDLDPVGSKIICRIQIRIRNYSFRIRIRRARPDLNL